MIEAGDLRHRVRFDRLVSMEDSAGDPLQDQTTGALLREWVPVITLWASIKPLSAREYRQSAMEQNEFAATIAVRYNRLVTDCTNLRAVHVVNGVDAVFFNISGPLADRESGQEYLTFPARAGVSDGA